MGARMLADGRGRGLSDNDIVATVTALAAAAVVDQYRRFLPGSIDEIIVGASLVATGLMSMIWNVITVSLRQRIAPDELLGRVNAGYRLFAWGTMPVGALLGGVLAQVVGFEAVFVLGAIIILSLLLFRRQLSDEAISAAERAAETSPLKAA